MRTADDYRAHAARCRSLTRWLSDGEACDNLRRLALECDEAARRLDGEARSWTDDLEAEKAIP